jgi:outer membrane protein
MSRQPPKVKSGTRRLGTRSAAVWICAVNILAVPGCQKQLETLDSRVIQARNQSAAASGPRARAERVAQSDAPAAPPQLPVGTLTREQARELAVRANPDIHAAKARIVNAAARAEEIAARYWPTVTFTQNSARTFQTPASRNRLATGLQPSISVPTDLDSTNIAITTLLNALRRPLFGNPDPGGNSNSFSEHSSSFTATWSILDFVRDEQWASARHLELAAEHSLRDVERIILRAVDAAYFRVQLAEEQIRISLADLEFSEEQAEEARKLRNAGRASESDVANFEVRALSARTDLSVARGLRDQGRVVLAELTGVPDARLPEDLDFAPLADETSEDLELPQPEPWVRRALAARPDIGQLEEILASEVRNVAAAKALYSPTLAVSGSYGFDRGSNLEYSKEDQSSAVGVELRWDLFTGGARDARVRNAESRRVEAAAQLDRLRLAVQSDVRTAVIQLNDAQQRITLQRETLRTAEETRRIVRAAYVGGKEPLTRLNEAQRDFITAEAGLALARIRLRQAWSDLHASVGYLNLGADDSYPKPVSTPDP